MMSRGYVFSSSFILLPLGLFGVPGPTLGFAKRAYRCIPVNLLVTRQTGLAAGIGQSKLMVIFF
jgi:hypothetical protein